MDERLFNIELSGLNSKGNSIKNSLVLINEQNPKMAKKAEKSRSRRASQVNSNVKVREDRFSQFYSKMVNNREYKVLSVLISLGALYMRDIVYSGLPKEGDFYTLDVVLSIVFFFLFSELILYSLTHRNYGFTFFFWLDLVGTASILIDIPWIMLGFGLDNNIFLIVKGGRMGRAARGAGSVRFIKLIKMVRMIKLFRIVQLFRKRKSDDPCESMDALVSPKLTASESEKKMEIGLKPTKMGSLLADRVTQKVILGVLLSFLILPLFDVGAIDQGDKTFIAIEDLEYIFSNHHNETDGEVLTSHMVDYNHSMIRFDTYHPNVLFLRVASNMDNFSRIEHDSPNPSLRPEEQSEYQSEFGVSSAVLDIRQSVRMEAILNMCLTSFIMSVFAIGSFVISMDAFILVYPLEYLVVVLKRLTAIAVQRAANNKHANKCEEELFSCIMQSMTDIFYSGKREQIFINSVEQIPPKFQPTRESMKLVERLSIAIVEDASEI